jgi:very-short-patch-repair endonuclease
MGTKFFKGRLCKKEDHEYENSGKSLRYISTGACSECNKSFNEEFKINNPYYNINWYNSNRESHLKQCKEFYDNKQRKYCEENNINYEEFKNGNKSKGELIVCAFLMENNINFEYGKLFFNCLSPKGNKLGLDFTLLDYNICIEVDGEQHYKPKSFGSKNLEKVQERFKIIQEYDQIKNRYCEEHGIKLIRIHYKIKNIKEYLLQQLGDIIK